MIYNDYFEHDEDVDDLIELLHNRGYKIEMLGMQLYDERKIWKMTQQEMSQAIGISVNTISRLESGQTNFREKTIDKVKRYLQIPSEVS